MHERTNLAVQKRALKNAVNEYRTKKTDINLLLQIYNISLEEFELYSHDHPELPATPNEATRRRGAQWTTKEDELLLNELENNLDFEAIGKRHQRTTAAVRLRAIKNARIEHQQKQTSVDTSTRSQPR